MIRGGLRRMENAPAVAFAAFVRRDLRGLQRMLKDVTCCHTKGRGEGRISSG